VWTKFIRSGIGEGVIWTIILPKYLEILIVVLIAAGNLYCLFKVFQRALVPEYRMVYPTMDGRTQSYTPTIKPKVVEIKKPPIYLFQAFLAVIGLLIVDLLIVVLLEKLIGPTTDQNTTDINVHPNWGTLVIHGVGPIALFLAIAVIGLFAIFKLSRNK